MILRENIPLYELTTLRVGGIARYVADCESVEDVEKALTFAKQEGLPWVPLGEGSNVLASDDGFAGVVIRMRIPGIEKDIYDDEVVLIAGAGVAWDALVARAAEEGLWGIENLAGIPGTVGAAPVQNIGAYGMELKDTLRWVEVLDTRAGTMVRLSANECMFGYRDSRFKHEPHLIILTVALGLTKKGEPRIGYADLAAAREQGVDLSTPAAIGAAVRLVRSKKFPDLAVCGTAGSFFKNPIVEVEQHAELAARYGAVPSFPVAGKVKIPLAFILDRVLGLRGYREGNISLFGNQPLVLVTDHGATANEVDTFASRIEKRVFDATSIRIEREVRHFPHSA